jgi:GMP synthase-like glutamine amidotransferase
MEVAHTWAVLQHVEWEGPGLIADEARARGLPLQVRRLDAGDAVPSVSDLAGLVVMGGPMSVHDTSSCPHLVPEQQVIRAAVERALPVLGVCLGAQLLAAALGAPVYRGPAPEIGVGEVGLTAEGCSDPVLGAAGTTVPVMHWHGDTFELPAGATHLARSARYANQAFRVGRRAYAFQFHVEVDRALADAWAPRLPPGARLDETRRAAIERVGRGIVARFFDVVAIR